MQCVPTACPTHDCTAVLVVVVAVVVLPVNAVVTLVLVLLLPAGDVDVDVDVARMHTPDPHVPDAPPTMHAVPSASIGPAKQLPSKQTPDPRHAPDTQLM